MNNRNQIIYILLVLGLMIAGFAIRIYDLQDAPLDFHPTRQLHSALMARGMYYSLNSNLNIPDWQRQTAIRQWKLEGMVEPPLMEWLVAVTYQLAGGVILWIARLYAILFWMIAAFGILLITREIAGNFGSLTALALFLFFPYAIYASRSFQPESFLVAGLVFTFWSAMQWEKKRTWRWAMAAGILGGLSILIKAVAIFFVAGIWLGLLLSRIKISAMLKNRQLWLVGFLCLLPYTLFMVYANLIVGGYEGQFSLRFFPQLWTQIGFYLRWVGTLRLAIGLEWLTLGLLGVLLVKEKHLRWMLIGAWVGYGLLGFTLSYHISSHEYYNLPVYLMVCLGVGVLFQKLFLLNTSNKWFPYLTTILLLFVITIYGYESYSTLKRTNYSQEVSFWEEMGIRLGHSTQVVALSEDYGYRLAYWGWNSPTNWMNTEDIRLRTESGQTFDFEQYFLSQVQDKDYFVVTLQNELEKQPELKLLLHNQYPIYFQDSRITIYSLKNK
jgi:4-amino-4-deoxy-L-arabinose transferase-like glycosyltransferase